MRTNLIQPISNNHKNYLTDESKAEGYAETISFPTSEEEVCEILRALPDEAVTLQGANTGVDGLAIPHGGHVMNFSKMNRILEIGAGSGEEGYAVVEPGVRLSDLTAGIRSALRREAMFWPPDPTETSATVGGIAATGAYGMNSCHYGETARYISALTYVSREGEKVELNRDTPERSDTLDRFLFDIPEPAAIVRLRLRLVKKPVEVWGLAFFFDTFLSSLVCAEKLQYHNFIRDSAWVESLEYLDGNAAAMVERDKESNSKIRSVPPMPEHTEALILMEIAGEEAGIQDILLPVMEITAECGCNPDTAWALVGESEVEKLHDLRHAADESIVNRIEQLHHEDERIVKLAVKPPLSGIPFAEAIMPLYEDAENEGLKIVLSGHLKNSDMTVNFLPDDYGQYCRAKELADRWMNAR